MFFLIVINNSGGMIMNLNYQGAITVKEVEKEEAEREVTYPHDRWEVLFVPPWMMMLTGERITSVAVDYIHPLEQTRLEQGDSGFNQKRIDQLNALTTAQERLLKSHKQGLLKVA